MAHNHGRIIEENHYYAYGLKIAGISSRKLGDAFEGNLKNNNLYNDKEFFDDADLNWYDYGFRNYDPQIGRFVQLDPLTDDYPELSPYQYAGCEPITNVDIDGLEPLPTVSVTGFIKHTAQLALPAAPTVFKGAASITGVVETVAKAASGLEKGLSIASIAVKTVQVGLTVATTNNLTPPTAPETLPNNAAHTPAAQNMPPPSAPWMNAARSQLGVGEKTGNNDGPDVDKYLKTVGLAGSGQPWCGAFVNWTLKQNGIKGTQNPAWALDWRNFGQSLSNPALGSIATLKRPGGGHVGLTAANDADRPGWIIILGGNQSDHVNYRSYPKRILKFNYPQNFTPSYNLSSMSGIPKGIKMQ